MKKNILCYLLTLALFFFLYGCADQSTSHSNNNTNNNPSVPKNPAPRDSALNIDDSSAVILSWESTDPDLNDTVKFDLYAGTSLPLSDIPLAANFTNPTYDMGLLFAGATYYWKVTAKDNHGASSTGNIWRFTIRTRPQ
ncbi:MAG: hypothetical protein ABI543_01640 [Ignavibacteria bacterium]